MLSSISITQNMKVIKIHVFLKFTLLQVSCISPFCSFWVQQTRQFQPVCVIESITLFSRADYRNQSEFSFLHKCSEHLQNLFNMWYIKMWDDRWELVNSSAFLLLLENPVPCGSKDQTEKCFSADKDQSTFTSLQLKQPCYSLCSQSRIFSQLSQLKEGNVMFCHVKTGFWKICHLWGKEWRPST